MIRSKWNSAFCQAFPACSYTFLLKSYIHVGVSSLKGCGFLAIVVRNGVSILAILCSNALILFIKLKQRKSYRDAVLDYPIINSIDFDDFTSLFTPQFLFRLRRYMYIKHSRQCFIAYPLHIIFSTLFSAFGYSNETLSLMFDILLLEQGMILALCS